MLHDPWPTPAAFDLDSALQERRHALERFEAMLRAANAAHNLVGRSTLADFHLRHLVDSAQLLQFAPHAKVWADLGSGAGFPGLVLAILLKGSPGAKVYVVESVAKKCRFLSEIVAELDLPAEVRHARAETLAIAVDIVTARACAPMSRLFEFAVPFATLGARGLFLKGARVESELVAARAAWRFHAKTWVSLSDPRGRVVAVDGLRHVG